jgi:hypothetical protein
MRSCNSSPRVIVEQTPPEFRAYWENGSEGYQFFHVIGKNETIDFLPTHVPPPSEGVLTLYADYSKTWNGYILLYLINATDDSINLKSEDGDVYIKLEAWDAASYQWVRAQHHVYSWCGNSYGTIALHARSFLTYRGMFPTDLSGDQMRIRYRLYNALNAPVVSNASTAHVSEEMIRDARFDLMSISQGDSAFVTGIALGSITTPTEEKGHYLPEYVRFRAIEQLIRFPSEGTVRSLEGVASNGLLSDYFRRAALTTLGRLKDGLGRQALQRLLGNTRMSGELYKSAFEALNGASKADAIKLAQALCTDRQFAHRREVFQVLSNALRLENEGERIESLYKEWWQRDSVQFIKSYGTRFDKAIAKHRSFNPSHYKFYLLDSTLYQCISSLRNDLSDPAIEDVIVCYAEFRTPDRADYLDSILQDPHLPDSTKRFLRSIYFREKRD